MRSSIAVLFCPWQRVARKLKPSWPYCIVVLRSCFVAAVRLLQHCCPRKCCAGVRVDCYSPGCYAEQDRDSFGQRRSSIVLLTLATCREGAEAFMTYVGARRAYCMHVCLMRSLRRCLWSPVVWWNDCLSPGSGRFTPSLRYDIKTRFLASMRVGSASGVRMSIAQEETLYPGWLTLLMC